MKTARPMPVDLSSSRRAQPVRQARQNPSRSSGNFSRSNGALDVAGLRNGQSQRDNVEIFPAITGFADAITALPKELVRHFTLLKEVDAKIFGPEDALHRLVSTVLNMPPPDPVQPQDPEGLRVLQNNPDAPQSVNGSLSNGQPASVATAGENQDALLSAYDPANLPRRQLLRQCTYTMQEMLVSLDEKNHVLSTATEALSKQLRRLDELYPHIEQEISEETRLGSMTHWAYSENRIAKPTDRSRREPAVISREAQIQAEEAAARSDARKQAMLAKKGRAAPQESDFDDGLMRKAHGNSKKGRPSDAVSSLGPGVTNGASGGPAAKRRKVEKGPVGGAVMERSHSGVFANGGGLKAKGASPRETPVPEPKKKAKVAPTNGVPKKRITAASANMSPAMVSSPLHGTFADAATAAKRGSPLPINGKPITSRGRQNSTQSVVENARQRPPSSASNKANGVADLSGVAGATGRSIIEVKATMKESANNSKGEHMIEDAESGDPDVRGGMVVGSRKDSTFKREETETNGDVTLPVGLSATTTKSGRASKPSTPAIPSFPEPLQRSRSSRGGMDASSNKRSHKKGAGAAAQQQQQLLAQQTADEDALDGAHGDEDDDVVDADEPTYCYCNGVSYGEMVACDNDGCLKEWFHLDCVGLKQAPVKAKWYCDDCKELVKGKKFR